MENIIWTIFGNCLVILHANIFSEWNRYKEAWAIRVFDT